MAEVLRLSNIGKVFGGIDALKNIDFDLREGEIHALLGENGAGKSTLVKILTGVHQADSGEIYLYGKKVKIANPIEARKNGIGVIYQELSLINSITVGENIFLGNEPVSSVLGKYDRKLMYKESAEYLKQFGIDIDPKELVSNLRMGQKRILEIVKALTLKAKILLLDEPTTGMSNKEIDTLFAIMDSLRQKKVTMIYISHYLDEVFRVCDRATVFRNGKNIATFNVGESNTEQIVMAMIGKDVKQNRTIPVRNFSGKETVLEVKDFQTSIMKSPVSFSVRKSEILGITGIIGAGKSELAHSIFGAAGPHKGTIKIFGKETDMHSTIEAKKHGLAFIPEDRKTEGLFLNDSVGDNIVRANIRMIEGKNHLLKNKLKTKITVDIGNKLEIHPLEPGMPVKNLSGGNQQKVVIAKWLVGDPSILLMDEPTRGIDIGAKVEIYAHIRAMSMQGKTTVIMSSEYEELLNECDRILVLQAGEIVGDLDPSKTSKAELLALSLGGKYK